MWSPEGSLSRIKVRLSHGEIWAGKGAAPWRYKANLRALGLVLLHTGSQGQHLLLEGIGVVADG